MATKMKAINLGDMQAQLESATKKLEMARDKFDAARTNLEMAEAEYKNSVHNFTLACQEVAKDNHKDIF